MRKLAVIWANQFRDCAGTRNRFDGGCGDARAAGSANRESSPHPSDSSPSYPDLSCYSFGVHFRRARTRGNTNRTPRLSEGASQSSSSKTRSASSNLPKRHKQSPKPCRQRKKGRLLIIPHGNTPLKSLPSDSLPISTPRW